MAAVMSLPSVASSLLVSRRLLATASLASQKSTCSYLALKRSNQGTSLSAVQSISTRPLSSGSYIASNQQRREHSMRCMSTSVSTSPDIIEKVKYDHKELEDYYTNYKKAHKAGQEEEAGKWFNQFVWEVSRHAVSEELVLYPLIEAQGGKGKDLADQSRADHQETKNILSELQGISDPELFEKKMDLMMKDLREHIKKEETQDLVFLKDHVDDKGRETAGTTFALGKNFVPTRPHAGVPNKPAALEAALGLLVTPFDKLRDAFTAFPNEN